MNVKSLNVPRPYDQQAHQALKILSLNIIHYLTTDKNQKT